MNIDIFPYVGAGFFIIFWILVGYLASLYNDYKTVKKYLPIKFKDMELLDSPIIKFKTRCSFGEPLIFVPVPRLLTYYIITSIVSYSMGRIYLYENYMVIKYSRFSQKFEYNKDCMKINKSKVYGENLQVSTPAGDIFFNINKKQRELIQSLIDKNSD